MPKQTTPELLDRYDSTDEAIEAYLDGDLSDLEARRIERRAGQDPDFAAELDLARRIQGGLRSMQLPCPPEVMVKTREQIELDDGLLMRGPIDRIASFIASLFTSWRPALAISGTALAVVALLTLAPLSLAPTSPPSPLSHQGAGAGSDEPLESVASLAAQPGTPTAEAAAPPGEEPTSADVEAARREVELAFAYLGKLGRTAESSVKRLTVTAAGSRDAI